jgi:endonuclease/exonuclease/phosphatase family metal-dependent hydrolase
VAQTETAFYRTALQKYGLPLDSRKLWTKADWQVWAAMLTGRREDFDALIAPLYAFLNETPDRVPFSDWYQTDSAKHCHFRARSVVGGVFMPVLHDAALWQKYAARATGTTGLYAPLAPKAVAQTEPFRIATFNIRLAGASVERPADRPPNSWTCRVDRVCALITKRGFDLVGLQEAQANQIDDMLARLGAPWTYVGVGRDDGKRRGEFSCIFYKKNRFEVRKSGTFWLSETPEAPGSRSWKTACPRVCTWADMKDLKTGKTFVAFNTHLDHVSKDARRNGMKLILERMARYAQGRPVFLTGDMNATPEKRPVDVAAVQADFNRAGPKDPHAAGGPYAIATANLRDSFDISRTPHTGPVKTFSGFKYVERPEGQPIDYIFVSAGIHVLSHATLDDSENQLYPSDHFPVVADVMIE